MKAWKFLPCEEFDGFFRASPLRFFAYLYGMALSEFNHVMLEVKAEKYLETARPPADIRDRLDLGYRIENQSLILFEIRPHFDTGQKIEIPYAKTTFSKAEGIWKIYWHRADGKWHRYPACPSVDQIEEFFAVIDEDQHACFKG